MGLFTVTVFYGKNSEGGGVRFGEVTGESCAKWLCLLSLLIISLFVTVRGHGIRGIPCSFRLWAFDGLRR